MRDDDKIQSEVSQKKESVVAEARPRKGRRERYREAAAMLQKWSEATDGYDEWIWPLLEEELKDSRTRLRE